MGKLTMRQLQTSHQNCIFISTIKMETFLLAMCGLSILSSTIAVHMSQHGDTTTSTNQDSHHDQQRPRDSRESYDSSRGPTSVTATDHDSDEKSDSSEDISDRLHGHREDISDVEFDFGEDFEKPWETSLFQWMAYPSLSHLPLSHRKRHHGHHEHFRVHGNNVYAAFASRGHRQTEMSAEHLEQVSSVSGPPQTPTLSRHPDRRHEELDEDSRRLSQLYGHERHPRYGHERQPRSHRHREPSHEPSRHTDGGRSADERRRHTHLQHGRTHKGDTESQHSSNQKGRRHLQEQIRQRWSGNVKQHRARNAGSRLASSRELRQSISSLPHRGDQIVFKLPSETPPELQSSPILYGSSARRNRPVSTEFVSLSGFSDGNTARRLKNLRRVPGGYDTIDLTSHRRTQNPRKKRPRISKNFSFEPPAEPEHGRVTHDHRTPQWDGDNQTSALESLGQDELLTNSEEGEGEGSLEVRTTGHQGRVHGQGDPGFAGGDEDISFCSRQLDSCRHRENEGQVLRQIYHKNLQSLRLVLTEALDRLLTDPAQLLDQTVCDVIVESSSTTSEHPDHTDINNRHDGRRVDRPSTHDGKTSAGERKTHSRSRQHVNRERHSDRLSNRNGFDSGVDSDTDFSDLRFLFEEDIDPAGKNDSSGAVVDDRLARLGPVPPGPGSQTDEENHHHSTHRTHSHGIRTENRPDAGVSSSSTQSGPDRLNRRINTSRVHSGQVHIEEEDDDNDVDDDDVDADYGDNDESELDVTDYEGEDTHQVWESWRRHRQEESKNTKEADDSAPDCVLGPWTDWSGPVGFGVIERRRFMVSDDEECKLSESQGDLVMRVDISVFNANHTYYKAPEEVGQDFEADFTRSHVPRDLLLVLDASGSIEEEDFQVMRDGVDVMVRLFCGGFGPGDTNNRLAILMFASEVYPIHRFSDDQSPETLQEVIANITQPNGNTCTGDALQFAHDVIFTPQYGARPDVVRDTLIVTDGHSNCGEITVQEGAELLQSVSHVFALGVGLANDTEARWELNSVVSNNDPRHIFSLARFQDFKAMMETIEIRQQTLPCLPIVDVTSAPEN